MPMNENDINQLEMQDEALAKQVSIEEKKAIIAQAKKKYGTDWRKMLGEVHSGLDWNAVKFRVK